MIRFELVTLDGIKFGEEVHEVVLPTSDGYIAVFPDHAPLVSIAVPGVISVRRKSGDADSRLEYFATNGGVIEIGNNVVKVLVDEADREDEISEQEAQQAFERAQKLRTDARDRVSIEHAQALVDRQASRLKVAELRRYKRR
ncbi:MAG TPA: ATP synthase F1 subunit epsilon [Candidatus Saccharibacteria bacterium]|nr:ATP synthase F1 subunit epsilon [Candidatus Saccharibacteria bacterium]